MSGSVSKLDAGQVLRHAFDDESKRLRVDAQVTAQVTSTELAIDASSGDNISVTDASGQHSLTVNPDGSIDANVIISQTNDSIRIGDGVHLATTTVVSQKTGLDVNLLNSNLITSSKQIPVGPTQLTYGTVGSVEIGAIGTAVTYTVPSGNSGYYLQKAYISGNQNGSYTLYLNNSILIKTRMAHTQFSQTIDLNTSSSFGIMLTSGDVIRIDAENNGTGLGTFDATLQFMELN